jgi:hypothetical protein
MRLLSARVSSVSAVVTSNWVPTPALRRSRDISKPSLACALGRWWQFEYFSGLPEDFCKLFLLEGEFGCGCRQNEFQRSPT